MQANYLCINSKRLVESFPLLLTAIPIEHCFKLGTDAQAIFHPDFLDAYSRGDFSSYPFMQQGFADNALRSFELEAPVRIYQGTDDAVVPVEDIRELVGAFEAAGMNVELVEVSGGGHEDIAFGYLATPQSHTADSMDWLRENLGISPARVDD